MNPTLLIVTPTLGRSEYFAATKRSIAELKVAYLHYIVCPPGEKTRLQSESPGAVVISEGPGVNGLYGAINCGLTAAKNEKWEWFTYINDDDLIYPAIETCLIRAAADDDLCYGRVDKIDERGRRIEPISTLRSEAYFLPLVRAGISGFNQQGALLRRRILDRIAPFDTRFKICADLDLFVRAVLAGARLKHFPVVTGAFRIRPGQISQDVPLELAEKLALYKRNGLDRYLPEASRAKRIFRLQNAASYLRRVLQGRFHTSYQLLAGGKRV